MSGYKPGPISASTIINTVIQELPSTVPRFSFPGPLVTGTESAPETFEFAYTSSFLRIDSATNGGTTQSVFTVYKNAVSLGTFALPANAATSGHLAFAESFAIGDTLGVACTTAGNAAADCVVKIV